MVKVLRSFVRGPLEPYVVGFMEALLQRGYTRSSAFQISASAFFAPGCALLGSAPSTLAILCSLCRRRHKFHYADLRIMPILNWIPLQDRGFVLPRSA